jgi:DASS family divalent anion:Na+ symporter
LIAELAAKTLNIQLDWGTWALAAILPGMLSLIIVPLFLYWYYPPELKKTPEAKGIASDELLKMGPVTKSEMVVAGVFVGALVLWSTSQFTKLDATLVALMAVSVMILTNVLTWNDVIEEKGAWDTMVWMGALITLAGALAKLGFIGWFAKAVAASMSGMTGLITLGILIAVYMYSHYAFASLVAHITAMYPAFIAVAAAAGAPPYLAALSLGYVANLCMSLTHYAAGPSPIFFGSGYIDQGTWWKLGFMVSVINMVIWIGAGSLWWKVLGLW